MVLDYRDIKVLLKKLGINPYDFYVLSGDRVTGWFPDLPEREPIASVDRLVNVIWEES